MVFSMVICTRLQSKEQINYARKFENYALEDASENIHYAENYVYVFALSCL